MSTKGLKDWQDRPMPTWAALVLTTSWAVAIVAYVASVVALGVGVFTAMNAEPLSMALLEVAFVALLLAGATILVSDFMRRG